MMRKILLGVSLGLLWSGPIPSATVAAAAEITVRADKPTLVPHTKFVFKFEWGSTWIKEYIKKDGGFLIFENTKASGKVETYRTTEDLASVDVTKSDGTVRKAWTPHSGFVSFPLYVGKKWVARYTFSKIDREDIQRERNCSVIDYEDVKVKAGTFPSFIIDCTNQREDRNLPAYERYAYAPDVGQVIDYSSPEFELTFYLVKIIPPAQ